MELTRAQVYVILIKNYHYLIKITMSETPSNSPKLSTVEEVVALMAASKSEKEWIENCDKVKADFNGYPDFWYSAIVLSGLAEKTAQSFGLDAEIHIQPFKRRVDSTLDPYKHQLGKEEFYKLLSLPADADAFKVWQAQRTKAQELGLPSSATAYEIQKRILEHQAGLTDENSGVAHPVETTPEAKELSPELQAGLTELKANFDSLPALHPGIEWVDVERSLIADQEALMALIEDNADGFSMNVFGEEDGSYHFASAWTDYTKVREGYRTIMFDKQAQKAYPQCAVNGNAVDIASNRGAKLSPRSIHEKLIRATNGKMDGWCWLETDEATRKSGYAVDGDSYGVDTRIAGSHYIYGSLRFSRRVKKA